MVSVEDMNATENLVSKEHKANAHPLDYLRTRGLIKLRPSSAAMARTAPALPVKGPMGLRPQSAAVGRPPLRPRAMQFFEPPGLPPAPLHKAPPPPPPAYKPPPKIRDVVPRKPIPTNDIPWDPTAPLGRPRTPQERRDAIESFFGNLLDKHRAKTSKSITQRLIDGELGPCAPMDGVKRYPYTAGMRLYQEEFSALVCSTITHPYVTTSVNNSESIPFDVLSGMAYDDATLSGLKTWVSESERSFVPKDLKAAKNANGVGVRSECVQFLG